MIADSVTAKDRHVINSCPLVDTKYREYLGGNWATYSKIIYYFMIEYLLS